MWDVKLVTIVRVKLASWFYLNYVGCKAEIKEKTNELKKSFTLTMWDVKKDGKPLWLDDETRFYLNYVGCKACRGYY